MASNEGYAKTLAAPGDEASRAHEGERAALTLDDAQRYRPRVLLGEGGMGDVWLFDDDRVGRSVALKRLHGGAAATTPAQQRFLREARVQAMIEHPAVVPVYDVGVRDDGSLYFTMRRIDGRTLEELLLTLARGGERDRARWTRRRLLTAFVQVCQAVHFAHLRGVVHRDLKPANIMLGSYGEVYVLDWGIAKVLREPSTASTDAGAHTTLPAALGATPALGAALTSAGAVLGTPGYIAPELIDGRDVASPLTDVYSLGATLFELLTRRPLHEGPNAMAVLGANLASEPRSARALDADVPLELDALCARALERDPTRRVASALELAEALERYLDGDRDRERRAAEASSLATRAEAAAARALAREATAEQAQTDRSEALRAVLQALTLDAQQDRARATLLRLLVEVPAVVPRAVEDDIAAAREKVRLEGAKQGRWALLLWAAGLPFCALIGIRWRALVVASALLNLAAFAAASWIQRRGATGPAVTAVLGLGTYVTIALFSTWLGPFVFVPTAAAVTTLIFLSNATERERPWFVGLGVASAALPLLAQWAGLVPRQFEFRPEGVLLRPGALALPEVPTVLGLLVISVGYTALPAVFVGRLNAALVRAQRQLFLQAWQLRSSLLEPPAPPPPAAPSAPTAGAP